MGLLDELKKYFPLKGDTLKKSEIVTLVGDLSSKPKPLKPTDPAPTTDGVYIPTITQNEAGTPIVYGNAGGLTVNTAKDGEDEGMAPQLIREGVVWVKGG